MGRHIYTNGKVPFIFTGWILLTQFFFVKAVPILMKMYMNTKYIKCNTFNQLFHKNINHKDQSPKKYHSLTSVISVRSLTIVTLPTQLSNVDFFFFFFFIFMLVFTDHVDWAILSQKAGGKFKASKQQLLQCEWHNWKLATQKKPSSTWLVW